MFTVRFTCAYVCIYNALEISAICKSDHELAKRSITATLGATSQLGLPDKKLRKHERISNRGKKEN